MIRQQISFDPSRRELNLHSSPHALWKTNDRCNSNETPVIKTPYTENETQHKYMVENSIKTTHTYAAQARTHVSARTHTYTFHFLMH